MRTFFPSGLLLASAVSVLSSGLNLALNSFTNPFNTLLINISYPPTAAAW